MHGPSDPAHDHMAAYLRPASLNGVTIPDSPFFSAADTARLMGFPTREALAKARRAGRLPIQMIQLPGRRGWFTPRAELWNWLQRSLEGGAP